ncbi:hypothetical protein [Leuconostoc falkenbergense]
MVTGAYTVDGHAQYFDVNGVQTKGAIITLDGVQRYYQAGNGNLATNQYVSYNNGWYYANAKGELVTGAQSINGNVQYFASNGQQIKGQIVVTGNQKSYYDANTGNLIKNDFLTPDQGKTWYYADQDGNLVTGVQNINGHNQYFDDNGIQIKDQIISNDGQQYYYQGGNGDLVTNRYISYNDSWYYADATGVLVTGQQIINGETQYFRTDGRQVKGQIIADGDKQNYYDADSGNLVKNNFVTVDQGKTWYYADQDGDLSLVDQ